MVHDGRARNHQLLMTADRSNVWAWLLRVTAAPDAICSYLSWTLQHTGFVGRGVERRLSEGLLSVAWTLAQVALTLALRGSRLLLRLQSVHTCARRAVTRVAIVVEDFLDGRNTSLHAVFCTLHHV